MISCLKRCKMIYYASICVKKRGKYIYTQMHMYIYSHKLYSYIQKRVNRGGLWERKLKDREV